MKKLLLILMMSVFLISMVNAVTPTIEVNYPVNNSYIDYGGVGVNLTLNFTTTSGDLSQCWYNYNYTNVSLNYLEPYLNSHGYLLESSAPATEIRVGMRFTAKYNIQNPIFTKDAGTTGLTLGHLMWTNGTLIESKSFVGDNVTFTSALLSGGSYRIEGNSSTTYTFKYNDSGTYPKVNDLIDWNTSSNGGSDYGAQPNRYSNFLMMYGDKVVTSCTTGVPTNVNFTLTNQKNITVYANDTAGNLNTTFIEWNYKVFENSRTLNSTVYDTAYETYSINLTANSSLTATKLIYNGTSYSMTNQGSGIWSYSRDIPSSVIGTQYPFFNFTYAGENFVSGNSTQTVNGIFFGLCNSTYKTVFLNLTFKDEGDLSYINATMPSSSFIYYLGSGTQTKTYTLTNNTAHYDYGFCADVNQTFHINPYVQYASSGYPQRIWNAGLTDYTNSTTNQVLYLLGSSDGIYETIQIINSAEQVIQGAEVKIYRYFGEEFVLVSDGTTSSNGIVSFWLNPDYLHFVNVTKTGYANTSYSFYPLGQGVTITLGLEEYEQQDDFYQGILISIEPTNKSLINDTIYDFNFILNSSYWDVEEFGFILINSSGFQIGGKTLYTNGGNASLSLNVGNNNTIIMRYYWVINGTYTNGTSSIWYINDLGLSQYSIKNFFIDLRNYINSDDGLLGLTNFGFGIILFLVILITTGLISYQFGISSPAIICGFVLALILFLDVGLNLFENLNPIGAVPHFISIFVGIICVALIFREVYK